MRVNNLSIEGMTASQLVVGLQAGFVDQALRDGASNYTVRFRALELTEAKTILQYLIDNPAPVQP